YTVLKPLDHRAEILFRLRVCNRRSVESKRVAFAGHRRLAQVAAGALKAAQRVRRKRTRVEPCRRWLLPAHAAFVAAAAAGGRAATTTPRTTRRFATAAERGNAARRLLRETDRQHPLFHDILTLRGSDWPRRLAIQAFPFAATLDKIAHIDDIVRAQNDVIAAGTQSISRFDCNLPLTWVTKNFQAADDAPTV